MVDLFQERYRELPAFQKAQEYLEAWANDELSTDELTIRVLMLSEHPISWDTLCANCAALIDKNYEQYREIEQLKEQLNPQKVCECGAIDPFRHHSHEDF
jgi:hypothetical protein